MAVIEGWTEAEDGTRIAYRDHGGDGTGLILLHGGGANLESMDQFADRLGPGRRAVAIDIRDADILRMYRDVDCPTLIIRCTESGAPAGLDEELDGLVAANPFVSVLQLPLTPLAPAWDALYEVASHIEEFLEAHPF